MISIEDFCETRGESNDNDGWKMTKNRASFVSKLVMIGPTKNYYFWWVGGPVC